MKNPNGPSIEDVDDWNDSLRDKTAADATRNILLDAVDGFEAKQLDDPELCGNCLKPYSEHYPDLKCVGKSGATTWFPKRISDALERGKRRLRRAQIALGKEYKRKKVKP
jgi:hypothetical protein